MRKKRTPVVVDLFAGGGGASHGIRSALGVEPMLAVNHCPAAVEMHAANHPSTIHMTEDLYRVLPFNPGGMPIDLLHGSPDCTFFSRAKGAKPLNNKRRMLAWVVLEWARSTHPAVITLENVPEFVSWCPLHPDDHPNPKLRGRPIKEREGETFREFVNGLRLAGYQVEWRVLNACDYGAPTARKRLFIAARRDGKPIAWPEPTHGPGRPLPYRTAAECIDWSVPMLSIFATKAEAKAFAKQHKIGVPKRPLAEATMRRIAEGVRRYVLKSPRPYIVQFSHQGSGDGSKVRPVDAPLSTIVTKAEHCLVVPTLAQTGYGEREGQAPRALDLHAPVGTIVAGCAIDQPAPTILTGGEKGGHHVGLVAALMTKFYGAGGQLQPVDVPLHTIPTVDRFGLVTVDIDGDTYAIVDIKMRMLTPRELALMQGFPPDYILTGTNREQVARIGNSVSPPPMRALIAELFKDTPLEEAPPRRRRKAA